MAQQPSAELNLKETDEIEYQLYRDSPQLSYY